MDYERLSSAEFRDLAHARKEKIYSKISKLGSIKAEAILYDEYENLCEDAAGGDPVAQDILAEWFRNGSQIVSENMEVGMKWLILAGANGNKYALDRLKLHFNYAFTKIIDQSDFGMMANKYDIDEYNYQYKLGKYICDGVVDDMKINALELAKARPSYLPFSAIIMRRFDKSIESSVDKVLEMLRKWLYLTLEKDIRFECLFLLLK